MIPCQRWRDGATSYRPAGEPIDTRAYEVAPIPGDNVAKAFVLAHHYAASYPAARFRYGLYRHEELVGVAVLSVPANDLALRPLPESVDRAELGRFVLLDDVPANGETWFLARVFEHLRAAGLGGVVSFSDPMPRSSLAGAPVFKGHVGTIYQAHNATYLGQCRAGRLRLLPDGRVLHNRALAKIRARDQGWEYACAQLVAAGAAPPRGDLRAWLDRWVPQITRSVVHPGNHKYVWGLERAVRRTLPPSEKYPKADLGQLGLFAA